MHVLILAEGEHARLRKFICDLAARNVPLGSASRAPWMNDWEKQANVVQVGVREVKLLDVTFPETSGAQVLGMLYPMDTHSPAARILQPAARVMGFSRFPDKWKYKPRDYRDMVDKTFVSVVPLGWKRDAYVNGVELL